MTRNANRVAIAGATILLFVPVSAAGGPLGTVRSFPDGDPFAVRDPDALDAAVNDAGDAVVAGSARGLYVRERTGIRGAWGPRVRLTDLRGDADPVVAVNASGAALVVSERGGALVAHRRPGRGGAWAPAGVVTGLRAGATRRRVVLTDDGRAVLLQVAARGPDCARFRCRWNVRVFEQASASAPWRARASLVTPVITGFPTDFSDPRARNLALNRRGDALVAWTAGRGPVWAVIGHAGRPGFERPLRLSASRAIDPAVAIGDRGHAVVSWMLPDVPARLGTGRIQARLRTPGRTEWDAAAELTPPASAGRPVLDADGNATHASVDGTGTAVVVWTTARPGPDLGFRVDEVRAADARAGSGPWVASPAVADNSRGRFLAVRDVVVRRGRVTIAVRASSDSLAPDTSLLATRSASGAWTPARRGVRFAPFPIVASPGGVLMVARGDLAVATFGAVRPEVPSRPVPVIAGLRVTTSAGAAVARFSLGVPATVWTERTPALCGADPNRCAPRELPAGAASLDLGGLPAGRYRLRLAACDPALGCWVSGRVTFEVPAGGPAG